MKRSIVYLINRIIPNKGDCISVINYRNKLMQLGYNFYQAIGSLGGAHTAKIITITNNVVTRV